MRYLEFEFTFPDCDKVTIEILLAQLADVGFDSFEENSCSLKAYIEEEHFSEEILQSIPVLKSETGKRALISRNILENKNWNAEWEKGFQPITIGSDCHIRATFHEKSPSTRFEIVIDPKMSFGTGHHQTTRLVIKTMLKVNFESKKVLDMGCGTGILGILASMMGAHSVTGIDIDEWAYNNAVENIKLNKIDNFNVILGDAAMINDARFDIIIANITRNILISDMATYARSLTDDGKLLLSGFFDADLPLIEEEALKYGVVLREKMTEDNWTGALFSK